MIISRTPFRVSFFGGGTDYPAWYRTYGGAVQQQRNRRASRIFFLNLRSYVGMIRLSTS
jgi:galactokinase/mevalonate kinase-like predicted kinase